MTLRAELALAVTAGEIAGTIAGTRVALSDEKAAQAELAQAFAARGLAFHREHVLGPGERPDFFFPGCGLALEVKLRAPKMAIWRQLRRYAAHDAVHGLMLASNTAMGLPADCDGKPLWFASLGRAWV